MKAIKIASLCLLLAIFPIMGHTGPAARVGDQTDHGGAILPPGVPNVLIGNKPAARVGDFVSCPQITVIDPLKGIIEEHIGGQILPPGCPTVLINGKPAARAGDLVLETGAFGNEYHSTIVIGDPTVIIGGGL